MHELNKWYRYAFNLGSDSRKITEFRIRIRKNVRKYKKNCRCDTTQIVTTAALMNQKLLAKVHVEYNSYRIQTQFRTGLLGKQFNRLIDTVDNQVTVLHWEGGSQCSRSAGSICFWSSLICTRIRYLFVRIRIRLQILPSTSKKIKKNLDFYYFVTSS
jgi:hypothetical protein